MLNIVFVHLENLYGNFTATGVVFGKLLGNSIYQLSNICIVKLALNNSVGLAILQVILKNTQTLVSHWKASCFNHWATRPVKLVL